MSRETKIGMLTGLLVIVLIGVLLSEYLGDSSGKPGANLKALASAGEPARKAMQEPVTPPGIRHERFNDPAVEMPVEGQSETPEKVKEEVAGPVVKSPVKVEEAGKSKEVASGEKGNTIDLGTKGTEISFVTPEEAKKAADEAAAAKKAADEAAKLVVVPADPVATTYTIAKGDTLTIIAKKVYKSATKGDIAKIVAANKGVLKDVNTPLVIGKKLTIPGVAPVVAKGPVPAAAVVVAPPVAGKSADFPMPGDGKGGAVVVAPPAVTAKVYTVQAGDSLEKIARKTSPTNVAGTVKQIVEMNGLKVDGVLKVGQKLKMPEAVPAVVTASEAGKAKA